MQQHSKLRTRGWLQCVTTYSNQKLSPQSTSIGDAGIEGEFVNAVNKAIDHGLGIDEIEKRLAEIIDQMKSAG